MPPQGRAVTDPYDSLRSDPDLAALVDEYGELPLETADEPYERLVISIVNQLISTEAARSIRGRLFERFEVTPERMLAADEEELREVGLSPQKIEYVKSAAEAFREEEFTRERFSGHTDREVIDRLTGIRGVGEWTGKMFCMFVLGREDVFPVEDLAIRRGMEHLFGEMSEGEMVEYAERWRPFRSYASLYVWQAYVDEFSSVENALG